MNDLSDIEKQKLEQLNDDLVLLEALKKIFLERLPNLLNATEALSNDILGQMMRANLKAKKAIEDGFREIEKYKKVKIQDGENVNPAR